MNEEHGIHTSGNHVDDLEQIVKIDNVGIVEKNFPIFFKGFIDYMSKNYDLEKKTSKIELRNMIISPFDSGIVIAIYNVYLDSKKNRAIGGISAVYTKVEDKNELNIQKAVYCGDLNKKNKGTIKLEWDYKLGRTDWYKEITFP